MADVERKFLSERNRSQGGGYRLANGRLNGAEIVGPGRYAALGLIIEAFV